MIAKLSGLLDDFGPDWAVIDVSGVGYLVHCSAKTLASLGVRGDRAVLFTELQVSENDMRLIGFASAGERDWFRQLTGIQGVGSKVALAILSGFSPYPPGDVYVVPPDVPPSSAYWFGTTSRSRANQNADNCVRIRPLSGIPDPRT